MMIYLDYAATTPMSAEALQTYTKAASQYFGNEQSLHDIGGTASSLLQVCRKTFAEMIGGKEQGIFFTSGGSESNYLAIQSLLNAQNKKHIITTPMEHASIRSYFQSLQSKGYTITEIPVDKNGLIRLIDLEEAITEDTVLASIQHGNSEIGTVQNIAEIGALLKNITFYFIQIVYKPLVNFLSMFLRWGLIVFLFQHIRYTDRRVLALAISIRKFAGHKYFRGLLTKRISSRYSERSWHRSFLTAAENILKINKKKVYVLKGYDLTF